MVWSLRSAVMPIEQTTRGSNRDYRGGRESASSTVHVRGAPPSASASPAAMAMAMASSSSHLGHTSVRKIVVNGVQRDKFVSNQISTAKYNVVTFLPKFLYEQFRRYANIFFLVIGLLQQIPNVSPTGRFVTIVPFTVILMLTAIKELIEDVKRHRADDKVNNSAILVLSAQGRWETKTWKEVVVGDIVKVENETFFPADLILMSSSEPQGMCYIETANLDGETNLKIRSALPQTCELDSGIKMAEVNGIIECEHPNREIYEFKVRFDIAILHLYCVNS